MGAVLCLKVKKMNTKSMEYEVDTEEKIKGIKKGMMAHGLAVSCVSVLLVAVNAIATPDVPWAIFPIAGMSIGVTMHYLFGVYLPIKQFRGTY